MSYLVLARKYRPRNFEQMVGQEHVVQALTNALTQQRLHHAYLFTGTRGVGKTTVSRILAKSLNCTGSDGQGGITATPCGVCDACRDIDAGRFVDYVELDAASNRGVDEISQLLDQAVYKPVVGRFKVYMIDEVHMLSTTAFNAMLKTLEEPPDYLKFVLATTDPQKVPVTVLSRCLQFNLRPMAPQTVQTHLGAVLEAEGIEAEPGALRELSRAARGSMRDALSLTDQAIAFGAGALKEAAIQQMLGTVDGGHAVHLLDCLERADGAALVAAVEDLRAQGLSAAGTLDTMATLMQQVAVAQAAPGALDDSDPLSASAQGLAERWASDEIQLFYSMALHGRPELELAPDEYSGLVMVLLRMLSFRQPGRQSSAPRPQARDTTAPASAEVASVSPKTATNPQAPLLRPSAAGARVRVDPAPVAPPPPAATQEPPPWVDLPMGDDELDAPAPAREHEAAVPTEPARPAAVEPAAEVSPQARALQDRWCELARQLESRGAIAALVRELAWQAQCVAVDDAGSAWSLVVERETLKSPGNVDRLQAAVRTMAGDGATLAFDTGPVADSLALREAAARLRRQREAEDDIQSDPQIQDVLRQFTTARIVPGSIKPL